MARNEQKEARARGVKVHIQGFDDPLTGRLGGDAIEKVFGHTVAATVRSKDLVLVVNHEEQFEGPAQSWVEFEEPALGRKVSEVFQDGRRTKVSYSSGGEEIRISY